MATLNAEALEEAPEEVEEEDQKQQPKISVRRKMKEKSWFGKKCVKIFKLFTNSFAMTFLAEWGDRAQLATSVMAGINDVAGVCLGGVLGHFICTGLAVICGALISKKISVRMVTLVGALVFIGFAVASLFIDPYEENLNVPEIEGDGVNSTDFSLQSSFLVKDINLMKGRSENS
jgi:putative Ca2+/H+ antiporter (TMEM165/GDT1 family)